MVNIRPATADDLELIVRWLAEPRIAKWLDFGPGRDSLSALTLKVAIARGTELLFIFSPAPHAPPVGVVGLSNHSHAVVCPRRRSIQPPGANDTCCGGSAPNRL